MRARHRAGDGVLVDEAAHRARAHPPAARMEEHRVGGRPQLGAAREPRVERLARLLAERHDPILATLAAAYAQLVLLEISEVEPDALRDTQPAAVQHFQDGSVAQLERRWSAPDPHRRLDERG